MSDEQDIPLSIEVWLYLKAGENVTPELTEIIFWGLVSQQVFILHVERSPVKSEGHMLYVKPGPLFHRRLNGLEAEFRVPFQTRVAQRLKWNNYIQQVLRLLKNSKETEKLYILPQLKALGWKRSWFDFFRKRKAIVIPEKYGTVFEERILEGRKCQQQFSAYLHENDWNKM